LCGSGRAGHLAGTGIAYESRPVILGKVDAQQITGAAIISRYGMAQMHGHDLTQQSILFRTVQQSRRRQSSSLARSRYGPECHGTQRGDRPGLHGKPELTNHPIAQCVGGHTAGYGHHRLRATVAAQPRHQHR
jgi:hypothetical protein